MTALIGFGLLGVGLGCVVPMTLSAAGAADNVHSGKAVASVTGCGWAGFAIGPVVFGAIATSTTLHTALFLTPGLIAMVAIATWTAKALRRLTPPTGAAPSTFTNASVIGASLTDL